MQALSLASWPAADLYHFLLRLLLRRVSAEMVDSALVLSFQGLCLC